MGENIQISNWAKHPVVLEGNKIRLEPLAQQHFDELEKLAKEESIWTYSPAGVYGADSTKLRAYIEECLLKRDAGEWYAFTVVLKETGEIAGSTLYHSMQPAHKTLEIGATWLHPNYWAKGINTEMKYLMLCHCFETLGTMRVQLKASDNNIRSRKAIEKIGAKFEGILRKDKILFDGTIRNAAYYSIIDDEWPEVKTKLEALLLSRENI